MITVVNGEVYLKLAANIFSLFVAMKENISVFSVVLPTAVRRRKAQ
jgi:hypothetical protein